MSISVPEISANGGIYVLHWRSESIGIRIDRLDDRRQNTSGEITVKYRPPDSNEYHHLNQSRLTLTSHRERNSLAKFLDSRVPDIDWAAILEQACLKTLEKHREGEPIRKVGTQVISEVNRYRLNPVLLEDQPNMVYGTGGVGKTTLACIMALLVQCGEERLGLLPILGNVLWLDYETSEAEINDVAKRLKNGLGLDDSLEFDYRFCSQPVADDIASIQAMVLETQAKLIVVDSVGAACGGEPESADVILRYFRALRSLRVTTLSLDHVTKENTKGPFGSVYKWNACRQIWEAVKGSVESDRISIGVHHRKRNTGPLAKPLGFQFCFGDDYIVPEKVEAKTIPEILATMGLVDQIEANVLRQPMTAAELADVTGKKAGSISSTISQNRHRFVSLPGGKWGAKSKDSEPPGVKEGLTSLINGSLKETHPINYRRFN